MEEHKEAVIERLEENVWSIDQGFVRCFLITGEDRALLFDTGAEPYDLTGLVRSVTDRDVIVVQSHGDGDHTANSALFPEIHAHPAEYDVILRFRPELRDRLRPVRGGDRFDLGGCVLEVIEAPGHTPGSICLLDRARRRLFSGDTISLGPVFLFGGHRDIRVFRETLTALRDMGGYDTVYPCHNTCPVMPDILPDLAAAVDGALDGSLEGVPMEGPPLPDGAEPLCYTFGSCGILYIR